MKRKKVSTETVVEILFFLFLLVFYLMWARVQPNGAGPDEPMRYQIAYYIYQHGSLPVGDDPAVRNVVWGISYAFSPILDYMIAAVFMKLVSFITTAPFALLMAARFVNILLGLGTVWLALDMGKRLFDRRKAWIFAAFVGLLPGSLFVFTYVNCDALAVFSTAVIVYAWVRYLTEGWTYKNCIILAVGVAACSLSYYNAYGFILCIFYCIPQYIVVLQKAASERPDGLHQLNGLVIPAFPVDGKLISDALHRRGMHPVAQLLTGLPRVIGRAPLNRALNQLPGFQRIPGFLHGSVRNAVLANVKHHRQRIAHRAQLGALLAGNF